MNRVVWHPYRVALDGFSLLEYILGFNINEVVMSRYTCKYTMSDLGEIYDIIKF